MGYAFQPLLTLKWYSPFASLLIVTGNLLLTTIRRCSLPPEVALGGEEEEDEEDDCALAPAPASAPGRGGAGVFGETFVGSADMLCSCFRVNGEGGRLV
jgi:hypothetical protein